MLKPVLALLAGTVVPATAAAHVVFAEPQARAGSYYGGFLRVSHGCGTSPTVSVKVEIPDSVATARPQPKPGWTLAIDTAPLAAPASGEGGAPITRRVVAVTWTGLLAIDQFDQSGCC